MKFLGNIFQAPARFLKRARKKLSKRRRLEAARRQFYANFFMFFQHVHQAGDWIQFASLLIPCTQIELIFTRTFVEFHASFLRKAQWKTRLGAHSVAMCCHRDQLYFSCAATTSFNFINHSACVIAGPTRKPEKFLSQKNKCDEEEQTWTHHSRLGARLIGKIHQLMINFIFDRVVGVSFTCINWRNFRDESTNTNFSDQIQFLIISLCVLRL